LGECLVKDGEMDIGMEKKLQNSRCKIQKRLWVITELYYPENNQTGYYLTKIAEGLTDKFEVKVICGQPSYAARGTLAAKNEIYKKVEIFRVWGTTWDKDVLAFRLINMLTLGASIFFKSLLKFKKNEDILVVSAPPSLPFLTALAAKIRQARYTLVLQDKYPETLIAVGKAREKAFFVKILNKFNRWLYRSAKKIIVVGRDMQELVDTQVNKHSVEKTPIDVIQNWASLEEVEPAPRAENRILQEHNLLEKFVFLYAGNMGHPQDLESIIYCAEKLKTDERFHFLFLGSGVKREWLGREVEEKKLKNVTLLAPRPRNEQRIFLNACDVGLVPLVRKMRGVAMPSRTYNLLAAGKPILALTEDNSEIARVIEEDKVGWFVPPGQPEKLLKAIYQIHAKREIIPEMAKRARKSALEKYSLEMAIEKYSHDGTCFKAAA
jgi:glycosyltransferase involved in cell wall biosynthesis